MLGKYSDIWNAVLGPDVITIHVIDPIQVDTEQIQEDERIIFVTNFPEVV